VLSSFDTDLTNLDTGKQNLISSSNKLSINLVDVSGSNIKYADYPSSIASKFSSLDGQISTLTTLQNGDIANFEAIDLNFQNIDSQLLLKQDVLSGTNKLNPAYINAGTGTLTSTKMQYLSSITGDIMTLIGSGGSGGNSYPSISYDSNNNTTTISNELILGDNIMYSDNSIQTTAFTDSKNTDLSNVKSKLTNVSYSTNNTTITGTLTADNITSATLNTINNNITTNTNNISTLNTKVSDVSGNIITINNSLSTINSNITSLQNYDTNQTTLNTQVSNDITNLYNNKQNILSGTNKLNPTYIDAGTEILTTTKLQNLGSITSDLQTQLDGKQATITDGSLTIARTSGLQTALDSKKTIDSTYGYIHSVVNKGALGSVAGNLVLTTSDIGKIIRFTTNLARTVVLPSLTDVPDGAWIGISCSSAGGTSYAISIQNASGSQVLANFNANNTTISSGGNGKAVIVIGGAWVAMNN
jgi:archaellum component FlaC